MLLTFSLLFFSTLPSHTFASHCAGEDAFLYTDNSYNLLLVNLTTNSTQTLVSSDVMTNFRYFWVSPDLQYVLFAYHVSYVSACVLLYLHVLPLYFVFNYFALFQLWRHSFLASYRVYRVADG